MTAQIDIRFPDIRTPVSVAPGSRSSEEAAKAVTQPMRKRAYRLILLALQSAQRPLSREEIAQRTGYKECGLCGRLAELRIKPAWIEAVEGACMASSGKTVNGYRLAQRSEAA